MGCICGYQGKRLSNASLQGAVRSPMLFLVYINDVASVIPPNVEISMLADDIAVWSADKDVDVATERVQEACLAVNEWSKEWLMELNTQKCEVSLFSMDAAQSNLEPKVSVDGKDFGLNQVPHFSWGNVRPPPLLLGACEKGRQESERKNQNPDSGCGDRLGL
jgi:hypothetical protein